MERNLSISNPVFLAIENHTFLYLKINDDNTPAMKIILGKVNLLILPNNIPHAGSDNQINATHHRIHMYIDVVDCPLTSKGVFVVK